MSKETENHTRLMKQAGYASLSVAVSLIILKGITFLITGSVAILSSLFDSTQDLITSTVNIIAIRHATAPADKGHRFGHGKAQAIGGLFQAIIILAASLFLFSESLQRLFKPQELVQIWLGVIVTLFAIFVTFALIAFQARVIRVTGSLSIKADRAHYTGDILMNVGVIVSMLIFYLTDWPYADSLFGIGVALYLLVVVYQVIHEAFEMLMDAEMSEDFRKKIHDISLSFPEVLSVHSLKTRQSGSHIFVQFHIHMPDDMTLRQAHNVIDMIEDRIKEQCPNTHIIIHPEPDQHRSNL